MFGCHGFLSSRVHRATGGKLLALRTMGNRNTRAMSWQTQLLTSPMKGELPGLKIPKAKDVISQIKVGVGSVIPGYFQLRGESLNSIDSQLFAILGKMFSVIGTSGWSEVRLLMF